MDFLLLYHFGKLKGVAIEILQVLIDDITTNMIFEILAIKFLSEIEKYLAMATLVPPTSSACPEWILAPRVSIESLGI